ncbi:MAG: hypothetical protein M3N53_00340 [Actinomycetota bacterium]|nr:hypothetical protein [Actinomycetota bacterium]
MRIAGGLLAVLVIATAGIASLPRTTKAPLPSQQQLHEQGFAVWPEDTVEEGLEACADAEPWRLDADETAGRYATDVLSYSQPRPDASGRTASSVQYAITSPEVELGSVIHLRKYDRCWFVVSVEPRESGFLPSLLFAHDEGGGTQLVIGGIGAGETQVGYGEWETRVDASEQQMVDLPELAPDATGHIARLFTSRGVSDIDASPLGFVPQPATTEVKPVAARGLARLDDICEPGESFRNPRAALADLYEWRFGKPISFRYGEYKFRGDDEIERVRGDQWLLRVDDAELSATVPELKDGCWRVTTVTDPSGDLLNSLKVAEDSFTFDVRWGDATHANIVLGTDRGGDSWTVERLERPMTVSGLDSAPMDEPLYVAVVLGKGRQIVAAQYGWYQAR